MRKLDEYYQNPQLQSLKAVANAEIIRVESYYVMTRRTRSFQEEMPFISETEPVDSLTRILLNDKYRWPVRARAATLLSGFPDNNQAKQALVEACHMDPNLYVVQESILAFTKLTGYRSMGVFDSRSIVRWWEKSKPATEQP